MCLCCRPFRWSGESVEAKHVDRPMQHVQGYIGSHWTLPSGDYLLRITPAAAMATINTTTMQNVPFFLAVLMAIAMRQYYTGHIA